jgi:hypothetical protein
MDFRGSKLWDRRAHPANRMVFADYKEDIAAEDVKRRALAVLWSYWNGRGAGEVELDGPLWALIDLSHQKEAVRTACLWFRVAVQSGEDEDVRRMLCQEAYAWIERGLRCYR